MANASSSIIYMNSSLYSLLQCQSEEVIGKPMSETSIPKSIINSYDLAIKRQSKIENAEIEIFARVDDVAESAKLIGEDHVFIDDDGEEDEENKEGSEKNIIKQESIYKGYANVIPIRGKESSLDYYLMVLSKEPFS